MKEKLISLKEYAELYGVTPDTVRQKALRGGFKTTHKIGKIWVIDANEPYDDKRSKGGNVKVKGLKKAIQESFESTHGYFIYDEKNNEVIFQPSLNRGNLPDMDEWEPYEKFLGEVCHELNQKERTEEVLLSIENLREAN